MLWTQLFSLLSSYINWAKVVVGLLAIGGGVYLLKEFYNYRRYGPTCGTSGSKIVSRLSGKVQEGFKNSKKGLLALLGIIILFAGVITIVEFPCSAAVPLVFGGILANSGVSTLAYLSYIAIFVIFYLLDELIIFAIAVWKMKVWMASPKFVTWSTFAAGAILVLLGLSYIFVLI